jgi:DNA-binding NarL/FixJ family response regulator
MRTAPRSGKTSANRNGVAADQITVFVLTKRQLLGQALAIALQDDPTITVSAAYTDPCAAVAFVRETRPDVVLLYLQLSQLDGTKVAQALRAAVPDLKIIILAGALDHDTMFACAQSGAMGCVTEDFAPAALADAIKRVHNGEVLFTPQVLLDLIQGAQSRAASRSTPATVSLAPREREVLQAIATGLSPEQVADLLTISIHTVRTHLKNAMAKLNSRSKLEAVMLAIKHGLIDLPD